MNDLIACYVLFPNGTTHLTDDRVVTPERTLCGKAMPGGEEYGDETLSGIAATCKSCKRVIRASR